MKFILVMFGLLATLCGCASVVSTQPAAGVNHEGLTYFLPKRDFIIKVTVAEGKVSNVTFDVSASYPDLSERFFLNHSSNLVGTNLANIEIGQSGLLQSSKAVVSSSISDLGKYIGQAAGTLAASDAAELPGAPNPCPNGEHTFLLSITPLKPLCQVEITIEKLASGQSKPDLAYGSEQGSSAINTSGFYYRQVEPYRITATKAINRAGIVFSPNQAPRRFLPISRVLFSKNDSDILFSDGIPTKYNETRDSEFVALLKLPATILSEYFTAIGAVFTNFTTAKNNDAALLSSDIKLELAKLKYQACLKAIGDKDEASIKSLDCGK
jgi:hypothetical protein